MLAMDKETKQKILNNSRKIVAKDGDCYYIGTDTVPYVLKLDIKKQTIGRPLHIETVKGAVGYRGIFSENKSKKEIVNWEKEIKEDLTKTLTKCHVECEKRTYTMEIMSSMLVVSLKNSNLEKEEKERIINLVKTSNQLEIFEYDIEEEKYLEVSIEKGGFYTSFLIVRDKMNKNYIFDIHESTIKAKNIIDIKMSELMTDKYHYITYLDKKGFVLTESIQRFEEYELFKHITTHQKDELKEKNAIVEDIVDFEQISEKQYQILKEQQKQNS